MPRDRAKAAAARVYDGIDPIESRRAKLASAKMDAMKAVTFKNVAEDFIRSKQQSWKNDKHAQDPGRMLSMANGLFGFDDYLREGVNDTKLILHDFSGRWFGKVQLPFRYCNEATCP